MSKKNIIFFFVFLIIAVASLFHYKTLNEINEENEAGIKNIEQPQVNIEQPQVNITNSDSANPSDQNFDVLPDLDADPVKDRPSVNLVEIKPDIQNLAGSSTESAEIEPLVAPEDSGSGTSIDPTMKGTDNSSVLTGTIEN